MEQFLNTMFVSQSGAGRMTKKKSPSKKSVLSKRTTQRGKGSRIIEADNIGQLLGRTIEFIAKEVKRGTIKIMELYPFVIDFSSKSKRGKEGHFSIQKMNPLTFDFYSQGLYDDRMVLSEKLTKEQSEQVANYVLKIFNNYDETGVLEAPPNFF